MAEVMPQRPLVALLGLLCLLSPLWAGGLGLAGALMMGGWLLWFGFTDDEL